MWCHKIFEIITKIFVTYFYAQEIIFLIGMIVMVMVVVDLAVADAVLVPLMMIVHGGETNRKFQLEEILEKKDQNDQNLTFYQEANRLMKIQVCCMDRPAV